MNKRLYKSRDNRVLCGVCGGIGEYFNIDPVIVRIALVIFCCIGGSGVIAYILAACIMPERPVVMVLRQRMFTKRITEARANLLLMQRS